MDVKTERPSSAISMAELDFTTDFSEEKIEYTNVPVGPGTNLPRSQRGRRESETSLGQSSDGRATPDTHSLQQLLTPVRRSFVPNRKKTAAVITIIAVLVVTIVILAAVLATKSGKGGKSNSDGGGQPHKDKPTTPQANPTTTVMTTTEVTTADITSGITTSATTTTTEPLVYNPGTWMDWGSWSECSQTCGYGIHVRYRSCNTTADYLTHCPGEYVQTEECTEATCTVFGTWSTWSSWGNCNVSCGGGHQTRMHTCVKASPSDGDCVGKDVQQQQCSTWACPDCSRTCSNGGVLNAACDLCECSSATVTGRVVATNSAPIQGALVYADSSLGKQIAVTETDGTFSWNASCPTSNITVSKDGFITNTVMVTTDVLTITLEHIVLPHITVEPQPKSRLIGENLTLCCKAEARPEVLYYEWFRNSMLIDQSFYPNGTDLHIEGVTTSDSGLYWCRANTLVGAAVSKPAQITVKGTSEAFCTDAFEQRRIHLPSDCVQPDTNTSSFEVGDCKPKSCRRSGVTTEEGTCRDSSPSCCGISDFDIVQVQCTGYKISVMKVKSCGCANCDHDVAKIAGKVKMYGSGEAVGFAKVSLNRAPDKYATSSGSFQYVLPDDTGKAVVAVEDNHKSYRRTTKVIDISEGTTGSVFTTLYILDTTGSTFINPSVENVLYIAEDPSRDNSAIGSITVPENAFVNDDYSLYTDNVTVLMGVLNAKVVDEFDILPGVLMTVDSEGHERELYTLGLFWIHFLDLGQSREVTLSKHIEVSFSNTSNSSTARVWKLNEYTGYWNQIEAVGTGHVIGQIESTSVIGWYSIGYMSLEESDCYYKVRIYESTDLQSEIPNLDYQIFQQAVHIGDQGVFATYGHTFSPSSTCFKTVCNGNTGYIELWTSNINVGSDEYLLGANPAVHQDTGITPEARTTINYALSSDDVHLNLKFVSSLDGPFYQNEARCLASSTADSHFKFYHKDITNDVYTYRYMFDLSQDINKTIQQEISKRVWFPDRSHGIEACYIKVRVNITRPQHTRVRAVSMGGSNPDIANEILGIRETFINTTETVCLEYKCSGLIDVEFSSSVIDYTKVSIQLDSSGELSCKVTEESQDLLNNPSGYNSEHIGDKDFTFYAPRYSGPHLGVYIAKTTSQDIYWAKSVAHGECRSGVPTDDTSINPDVGVAVYFQCS